MAHTTSIPNLAFWLHLLILFFAWSGPFLVWWPIMVLSYGYTVWQFWFFGKCLVNDMHGQEEREGYTLYAEIFDHLGISYDAFLVKRIVRGPLYPILICFTLFWQVYLENEALWLHKAWWLSWIGQ